MPIIDFVTLRFNDEVIIKRAKGTVEGKENGEEQESSCEYYRTLLKHGNEVLKLDCPEDQEDSQFLV